MAARRFCEGAAHDARSRLCRLLAGVSDLCGPRRSEGSCQAAFDDDDLRGRALLSIRYWKSGILGANWLDELVNRPAHASGRADYTGGAVDGVGAVLRSHEAHLPDGDGAGATRVRHPARPPDWAAT